jgi:hypothetical protein
MGYINANANTYQTRVSITAHSRATQRPYAQFACRSVATTCFTQLRYATVAFLASLQYAIATYGCVENFARLIQQAIVHAVRYRVRNCLHATFGPYGGREATAYI